MSEVENEVFCKNCKFIHETGISDQHRYLCDHPSNSARHPVTGKKDVLRLDKCEEKNCDLHCEDYQEREETNNVLLQESET